MSGLPSKQEKVRDKVIVNFCRLNKQKNIPLLISAFEEFCNIHPDYMGTEQKKRLFLILFILSILSE